MILYDPRSLEMLTNNVSFLKQLLSTCSNCLFNCPSWMRRVWCSECPIKKSLVVFMVYSRDGYIHAADIKATDLKKKLKEIDEIYSFSFNPSPIVHLHESTLYLLVHPRDDETAVAFLTEDEASVLNGLFKRKLKLPRDLEIINDFFIQRNGHELKALCTSRELLESE